MNGVLLINKEKGKTSRDMVNDINHIFETKKVGHTGTLDPLAEGVLVIVMGKYTKLVDELASLKKEYVATIKLGIKTDTWDITGKVLEKSTSNVSKDDVQKVLKSFKGKFEQEIPLYSAKKINGKKLYEYARKGIKIDSPKNEVEIFSIELISFNKNEIKFKCEVSKGTYIRSLIQSICSKLGVIGVMSELIRTKQGQFCLEDTFSIDDIKKGNYKILNCQDIFTYPIIELDDATYKKVRNGNKVAFTNLENKILLKYKNREVAIYQKDLNCFKPYIMLDNDLLI